MTSAINGHIDRRAVQELPQILRVLIQTVTGDGNLLLNVGPDETGTIPLGHKSSYWHWADG